MAIAQSLIPEFDHEMAITRKLLERTPEENPEWKPHARSMPIGHLAMHLATLPAWGEMAVTMTDFDLNPPGGQPFKVPEWSGRDALLATFDDRVARARDAISGSSDEDLMVPWTLKNGGQTIFTLPRIAVLRSFTLNHIIHHRGQFTVYLRLRDVPLPGTYGPSADEPFG